MRYDTVFVERDPARVGLRGFNVVRVLAIFAFHWMDEYYPCALVHWFTHMGDECDEVMGMWVVQPDSDADGSPAVGVIHLCYARTGRSSRCEVSWSGVGSETSALATCNADMW